MLVDQSKKILQFINEVGGITREQIDVLLPKADERAKEFYINALKEYIYRNEKGEMDIDNHFFDED